MTAREGFGWILAVARGGLVTARHFFVNMAFHALRAFGIRTRRPGAVTITPRRSSCPSQARY